MLLKPNKRSIGDWFKFQVKFGCVVACGFLAVSALPQVKATSGTTVVFRWDKDKVTVASDSRGTDPLTGSYHDNECKISAFGDKFFFVSSGTSHAVMKRDGRPILNWDSHLVARRAFESTKREQNGTKSVAEVSTNWANLAVRMFNAIPPEDRQRFITGAGFASPQPLFVGLDDDGEISAYTTNVFYDEAQQTFRPTMPPKRLPMGHTGGIARGQEIAREFMQGTSERARRDLGLWMATVRGQSQHEIDHEFVVQLVRWIILYDRTGWVGGSPEAIELSRDGTVRWIEQCPETENAAGKTQTDTSR
jgi:hypothetical protein